MPITGQLTDETHTQPPRRQGPCLTHFSPGTRLPRGTPRLARQHRRRTEHHPGSGCDQTRQQLRARLTQVPDRAALHHDGTHQDEHRHTATLAALTVALGSKQTGELSTTEEHLIDETRDNQPKPAFVRSIRELIRWGKDPLGEAYCTIRSSRERRPLGQTYTPRPVIEAMPCWASGTG